MITDKNATNSYFYWKGDFGKKLIYFIQATYSFFVHVITEIWNLAETSSSSVQGFWKALVMVLGFCGIVIVGFLGVLSGLLLVLLCVILYIAMTLLYYTIAWFVWGFEKIYISIRGLSVLCPTCNKQVKNPIYYCPDCHLEHTDVIPSAKYGIFFRKCTCGKKIPVFVLWKKKTLQAKCPFCSGTITPLEYAYHTIAFIGGKSVGKTFLRNTMCVMLRAFVFKRGLVELTTGQNFFEKIVCGVRNYFIEKLSWIVCWRCSVPKEEETKVEAIKTELKNGKRPNETALTTRASAIRLDLKKGSFGVINRLYLYDAPGEAFTKEDNMKTYVYYESLRTLVLVIDPLSLPNIRLQISNIKNIVHVSQVSPLSCVEKWLNSMESVHTQGKLVETLHKVRCAVVITKVDMPELQKLIQLNVNSSSEQCKEFLSDNGQQAVISLLEEHFEKIKYFAVSCTGGKPDGTEFKPEGIESLWSWILED